MHEFAVDEVLVRATLAGIITRYRMVARYEPEGGNTWSVWPKYLAEDEDPLTFDQDGIEEYCAMVMEAGI